jgi:HD-GYP domain-containing protein (c-di-GMP phosphodiesterase class II)
MDIIQAHPANGHDIVADISYPWPVAAMILQHHERWDGSGYPGRLAGDEILLGARMIAVADVVSAMAFHRPYRPALGLPAALAHLEADRGHLYDPEVVDFCLELFGNQKLKLLRSAS